MRIFGNVSEAMTEIERELFEMGINNHPNTMQDKVVKDNKDFDTKELLGYSFCLTEWPDLGGIFKLFNNDLMSRGLDYCSVEFTDRIGKPTNPGNSYKTREDLWERFLKDGKFSYTYSERIYPQLAHIIRELRKNPTSRQCVLTFYDRHQDMENMGGVARIPCSMYYQFLLREVGGKKRISLIYTMRSCDYYNHFPIDVTLAITMLEHVALSLNVEVGEFTMFMGSLHAYNKDFKYKKIY